MRHHLRAVALLALIFAGITCSEPSTGPRASAPGESARISLAPRFSPAAAQAYRTLVAAAIEITEIHIVLTGPDGVTRDTVIAFPAGQDTAHIEIDVPPGSNGQPFTALIELRSADHTVLFSGTQIVIARPSGLPPLTPPAVVINYSGPGRNTRTVAVLPPDNTFVGAGTIAYSATGTDSSGTATANLLVAWTSSDPTIATVTGTGNATANVVSLGKRGTTTITATTPLGVAGTSRLTVVPPAARLVVVSGGGQTALAGSTLPQPFVVEAQGADNLPVPGTSITFRAVTAGGSVSQSTPRIADAAGRASVLMTLGTTGGSYQYEAASGALTPVTVNQTATAPAAAALAVVSGNAQTDSTGRTLQPLVVRVTDQFGTPVSGVTVAWARVSGSGAVTSASSITAADGTASTTYVLGLAVGADVVSATVASIAGPAGTVQFTATTIARGAGLIVITAGAGQSGGPGQTLAAQVTARVTDLNGAPKAAQTVTWSSPSSGATFSPTTALTDAAGLASTTVTLGSTIGPVTITATTGTLAVSTSATVVVGAPASMQKVAGDNQSATVGSAVSAAPSVRVTDASGNSVAGVNVVFAVTGGGGSATGTSATTNATGVATVGSWTLGSSAGANTLTASAGALSAVFSATGVAAAGTTMTFSSAPSTTAFSGQALTNQPVLQLKDALGNNVTTAGVVVTAAIGGGSGSLTGATATSAAGGTVTFANLTITGTPGTFTLVFSSPGYTSLSSGPIAVSAGAAATIALNAGNGQTATVGSAVAIPPSVLVTDGAGNPVAGAIVTFGVITPGATISNGTSSGTTLNVTTNASGIAALASWTLGTTAQAYTLHATATGLSGSPVVFTATAVPGTGSTLAFATAPATTAASGAALSQQPVVQLKDGNGNNVTTSGVVITAAVVSGSGTLSNATATTTSGGTATFSGLTISGTVGQFTLGFSAPGYTTLNSAPIALSAGAASTIAANAGNGQSAPIGTSVAIPPSVLVTDAAGNPVAGVLVTYDVVTAGATISNGTTSSPTSLGVTTNGAGMAALASWTLGTTIGSYTLHARATNLLGSPAVFSASAVAGAGTQLAFVTPPAAAAANGAALNPQPVVQLKDASGNNVTTAGVVVTATITSGAGAFSNATATTNASGVATFAGLSITGTAGNFALQFAAPGYSALPFSPIAVGAGSAATIALSAGNGQTAAAGTAVSLAPAVLVSDASGNPVAGHVVTFSIVTAGATVSNTSTTSTTVTVPTATNGVATLTAWTLGAVAQPYTMNASAAGLAGSPVTFTANATAGAAVTIALDAGNGQSAPVGTAVAVPPSVRVTDAGGNPVAGTTVTFSVVTAGASIANASTTGTTLTVTTNATGIAALTSWTLGTAAQSYTLTATATGLTGSPVNFTATATAGSGSILSFNPSPSPGTSSGVPIAQQPGVQLRDAFNNPIRTAGVVVTASITSGSGSLANATATTNLFGVAQFSGLTITGTVGNFSLQFTAPGYTALAFSPIAVFNGFAANLSLSAGNNQTTVVSSAVPVAPAVLVTDAQGNPVPGTNVTFTAVTANSSVATASTSGTSVVVATNTSGVATLTSWTLGPQAGPYTMTASVAGLSGSPVNFTATGTAAAGSTLTFTQTPPSSAVSGTPFSVDPVVQLRDSFGNPVSTNNVAVTASIGGGTGSLNNQVAFTNSSGVAQFSQLTITGIAGNFSLQFSAPGYTSITFSNIAVSAGPAAFLSASAGNSQTAPAGSAVPVAPAVLVSDASGNPVAGTVVTFSVVTAGSTVSNGTTSGSTVTVTSGANGIATLTSWTLGTTVQSYSMTAAAGTLSGSPVTFTANATAGTAANIVLNAGGVQNATVNTTVPVPPSVRVTDANGNGVAGTIVTFAIVTPGSVVTNASTSGTSVTVTTNATGVASLNAWTLGTTAQVYTMNATGPGLSGNPVQFSATASAGSAATIAVQSGNGQTATAGSNVSLPPAVRVTDQFGNAVGGTVVTFNVVTAGASIANASTSGTTLTVTTNPAGVAQLSSWTLGNTAGTYTLTASASGLSGSPVNFTANATAAAGSVLVFTQAPPSSASSGVALTPQPVIQLRDSFGNSVSTSGVVVTATISSGTGTLSNASATTNGSGTATFSGLSITGQSGSINLQFAATGYTPLPFGPITLSAGSAASVSMVTGNGQSAQVTTAVATNPAVLVTDSFGNPVAGTVVTFAAVTGNGSSVTSGTGTAGSVTVTTNVSGVAALNAWTLGTVAQQYTLTAAVSGLAGSPVTFTATGTPGPLFALVILAGNNQTAPAGSNVPVAPSIRAEDQQGNGKAGVAINFVVGQTTAQVSNSTTSGLTVSVTTNAAGVATLASWTLGTTAGNYDVNASASGLAAQQVFTAVATAAAGTQLAFTQQPSSSATSGAALATQPIVQIRDSFGNPVSAVSVLIVATISSGSGTLSNASALTNASGVATFSGLTINGQTGNFNLQFNGGGYTPVAFGPIALGPGTAASIAVQAGNNQSAQWGQAVPIPPAALVTDANGNAVPGVVVTFTPVSTGGMVQTSSSPTSAPLTVTTNAQGIAALTAFYVGSTAGDYTLTAAASGLRTPASFTETALAGPATHLSFNQSPSTAGQSGVPLAIQPVVQLRDAPGNFVPQAGVVITATFAAGSGTFTNGTATTDATGKATFTGFAVNGVAGNYTITFTAPSLTGVGSALTLSAGPAAAIVNSATGSTTVNNGIAFPIAPQVRLVDNGGNNVLQSGVTITATVSQGSGTVTAVSTAVTDSVGGALFSGITLTGTVGLYRITYSSGSLTAFTSGIITLNAGAAASISVNAGQGQTATVSTTVAIPPSVKISDVSGNGVQGISVNFVATPTSSQIQNSSTFGTNLNVVTDAAGIARLISWSMSSTPQLDTITATVVGSAGLTGSPARIIAQAVARNGNSLSITTNPGASTPSGSLLSPQPVIRAMNGQGLAVPNVPVTAFIAAGSSPNATLSGTMTINTDANGFATFTNLRTTGSAGTYSLRFASPGYNQLSIAMSIP